MNWVRKLQRNSLANSLVKVMQVHRMADFVLRKHPLKRQTPHGFIYRVESVASLVVANELFTTDLYARAVALLRPASFIDLGANVGFFPVLLADILQMRGIKGLCVEPNPHLHAAVEFHLRENSLSNVHLVRGAVAANRAGTSIDFYLNPSHIASSATGVFNPRVALGGKVQRIRVPVINLAAEWTSRFPHEQVGLLKIDIEGAEADFLQSHSAFLSRVDAALIEWHKWLTSLDHISQPLQAAGFKLAAVAHEDVHCGTALFRRNH